MQYVRLIILVMLLIGCSSDGVSVSGGTPRVHGDERSGQERYLDCISGSKHRESRSERARCTEESMHPDPGYVGVSFPINF